MFRIDQDEAGLRVGLGPGARDAAAMACADFAAELAEFEAALAWAARSPMGQGVAEPRPRAEGAG
jgi:hypothetical protein